MSGAAGDWKVTCANFCHNHDKHIGFTKRPCEEGSLPITGTAKRSRTQQTPEIKSLIQREMLPVHNGKIARMTGKGVQIILLSKGIEASLSLVSRVVQSVAEDLHGDIDDSCQKPEAYLRLVADKNPGSHWRLEKGTDNVFTRACFVSNLGVHVANMGKRLFGFDGAHMKGDMNKLGVFLVATAKDYNNHILTFVLALVRVEDYLNWRWFLGVVREAMGDLESFTVVSDRQKGLLGAVADEFPSAGHRFCLHHIMGNITKRGISLSTDERAFICKMAKSDCENDFMQYRADLARTHILATEYLDKIDQCHWVKFKYHGGFNLPTYNEITSKLSEQANSWVGNKCRSSNPLDAFSLYFAKLAKLVSKRRQGLVTWLLLAEETVLVPAMKRHADQLRIASTACEYTA